MKLKNIVSPIQMWLLANGRCVGCGVPLGSGEKQLNNGHEQVVCKCGRIYFFDSTAKKYRRALLVEVEA